MAKKQDRKDMLVADQRQLWVYSHGLCSNPDCKRPLIIKKTDKDRATTTGCHAHLIAHSPDGPRGDEDLDDEYRDTYENMILLCGDCHRTVDGQSNTYTIAVLNDWKSHHEQWIAECVQRGMTAIEFEDLEAVTDLFASQSPAGSSPTVAPDISEKIAKNKLTEQSVCFLRMGVASSHVAGAFIHDLERTRPGIGTRVRAGFLVTYYEGQKAGRSPDNIFCDLMGIASNHSHEFRKQSAGLAVLGYLFSTCEVFEG
ncbi:MAG: hypothetical protein PF961_07690 [Planctomycetota bacterium]|jgi:hypothetical protein|nr:hypothetical protein [Planctomycetota bacterium]